MICNFHFDRLSPVPLDLFVTDVTFGKNRMELNTAVLAIVTTAHLTFTRKMEMLFVNVGIEWIP